jgi:hypothetical protein
MHPTARLDRSTRAKETPDRRLRRASLFVGLLVMAGSAAQPALAVPPHPTDDGYGRQWRQLYETTGLTWSQVAEICPRDGATPCEGSIGSRVLTGWVWGTADQVVELMGNYAPDILAADPPSVSGPEYFLQAADFLADTRWTFYVSGYGFYHESTAGWTSSADEAGTPIGGGVGYGWWPPGGGLGVGPVADGPDQYRGVFLWRPSTDDLTPPVVTPNVAGTLGSNGWYVSDVMVNWDVQDPESEIVSLAGCDPATISSDTTGAALSCAATSGGGTTTVPLVVLRDVTPPTVTCPSPAPAFQINQVGAIVTAVVTDATSGRATAPAQALANTSAAGSFTAQITGADRAGNRTTVLCPYRVAIPTCSGLAPTIVGNGANNVINGTSGRDVIVGLGGADTIYGKGGDDVICGGDGPDVIDGGDGHDWIDGEASNDDLSGGNGNDVLGGGAGNDSLRGGNGTDTCTSGETRLSSCEL